MEKKYIAGIWRWWGFFQIVSPLRGTTWAGSSSKPKTDIKKKRSSSAKQLGIHSYIDSQGRVFQYLNVETGSRLHFAKKIGELEMTQPSNQKNDFTGLTGLKGRFLKKVDDIWSSYQTYDTYDWVTSATSPHQITKFSSMAPTALFGTPIPDISQQLSACPSAPHDVIGWLWPCTWLKGLRISLPSETIILVNKVPTFHQHQIPW